MDCPECGAPEGRCEDRYHECLVKEFSEPGYGAVHYLTVAAYMAQHSSKLTKDGWHLERDLLKDFLLDHKDPASLVRQSKGPLDSGRRTFKIADKAGLPKIDRRHWSRTILDVRLDDAETYCQDITAWAHSVLEDAQTCSTL
jgi:hypothetical protein